MRRDTFTRRRLLQGIPLVLIRRKAARKESGDPVREQLEKIVARYGSELGDVRMAGR
ncbi:MAG TPA: hypothetical protein VLK65_29300 [Vicinamibacteria bacterium]|nr:hypothetical protein [Vicinamibacteria bacterium]